MKLRHSWSSDQPRFYYTLGKKMELWIQKHPLHWYVNTWIINLIKNISQVSVLATGPNWCKQMINKHTGRNPSAIPIRAHPNQFSNLRFPWRTFSYEILNQEICVRWHSFKAFNGTFLFVENTFPFITSYNCKHCVPYYYYKITHLILGRFGWSYYWWNYLELRMKLVASQRTNKIERCAAQY